MVAPVRTSVQPVEVVKIDKWDIFERHLEIIYCVDQFTFSTKVFYHDISFSELISSYSQAIINQIAAHIALFEGMKFCSLFPKYYDISTVAEHLSPNGIDIFLEVYKGVFAQHRYENSVEDYAGPQIVYPHRDLGQCQTSEILSWSSVVLTGCGGGKDSVLAMKILESAAVPFASLQYSHSVYGKAKTQHDLIADALECAIPINKHHISIYDDFADYPFIPLYFPENSGITAPETPVSVFESLFVALNEGYRYLCFAHERSANTGNLYWREGDCEVNHQWGKSFTAELLLNRYIQENLLSNFTYFSILQPLYDFRIFKNLSRYPVVLPKIHSCNVQKPWCKKCAKCAYVWLGLMATFPSEHVNSIFKKNLFDDPDLLQIFKQLLGLDRHTPFECIGEIDESRLNMKKCLEKGLSGQVLDLFQKTILTDQSIDWQEIEQRYDRVYETDHSIPDWIFDKIKILL
jgi:hypothetical protein